MAGTTAYRTPADCRLIIPADISIYLDGGIRSIDPLRYTPGMFSEVHVLPDDPAQLREAPEGIVSLVESQALQIAKLPASARRPSAISGRLDLQSLDQAGLRLEDEEIDGEFRPPRTVRLRSPTAAPKESEASSRCRRTCSAPGDTAPRPATPALSARAGEAFARGCYRRPGLCAGHTVHRTRLSDT